jgi:hypothetical protein
LWGDFHAHLIEKVFEQLAEAVPERYLVRTGGALSTSFALSPGTAGETRSRRGLRTSADDRRYLPALPYERSIDYSKPLTPPLDAAATAWLEQQLKSNRE